MDILLVSPASSTTESAQITSVLKEREVGTQVVNSFKKAVEELARKKHLIVVLHSFDANSDIKPTEAIRIMKQIVPDVLIVAISKGDELEFERESRKLGVYYYLTTPYSESELKDVLWGAIERQTRRRTK